MEWYCHTCTYLNSANEQVCVMCREGFRFFSTQVPDSEPNDMAADSAISSDNDSTTETNKTDLDDSTGSEGDENDSLSGKSIEVNDHFHEYHFLLFRIVNQEKRYLYS